MQDGISQESTRGKTEQDLEQRAVPRRVGLHRDEEEDEEGSCGDQHCGAQCLVREGHGSGVLGSPTIWNQALSPLSPWDSHRPRE